jgi:hypothetical protein
MRNEEEEWKKQWAVNCHCDQAVCPDVQAYRRRPLVARGGDSGPCTCDTVTSPQCQVTVQGPATCALTAE